MTQKSFSISHEAPSHNLQTSSFMIKPSLSNTFPRLFFCCSGNPIFFYLLFTENPLFQENCTLHRYEMAFLLGAFLIDPKKRITQPESKHGE